jgi:hypothetical protein
MQECLSKSKSVQDFFYIVIFYMTLIIMLVFTNDFDWRQTIFLGIGKVETWVEKFFENI